MNVLIVEDNLPEQEIMKEALKEARVSHDLHFVRDGIETLEFLMMQGAFQGAPKPDLIILDLNMPRKNGLEVLSDIKDNPRWKHIPVLVFSNSEFAGDICKCYTLGANAYLNKPADFQGFIDLAYVIDVFWFKLARYCSH
jgi:two-component system, chemotaxis family, response regulator Rcp1